MYLGPSPTHAISVHLNLSSKTGLVSANFTSNLMIFMSQLNGISSCRGLNGNTKRV